MRPCFALVVVLVAVPAVAQDAFEIQVYNSDTAAPGQVGAETHLNHFFTGTTTSDGTEAPTSHVTHLTIEPHVGLASWCEAGMYISTAIRPEGAFDYAGIKVRFKVRWPERLWGVLGLSLNQELSATPTKYEADEFGWELRPIIDVDWKRLYFAVNPIVEIPLAGSTAFQPEFDPGVKASVRVVSFLAVGVEYLAAIGRIASPSPLAEQSHRLFGALDFDWRSGRQLFELNVGVGYDFTGTEKWVGKLIFAVDLEPQPAAPSPTATP
jgi:hypothetical protein